MFMAIIDRLLLFLKPTPHAARFSDCIKLQVVFNLRFEAARPFRVCRKAQITTDTICRGDARIAGRDTDGVRKVQRCTVKYKLG